MDTSDKLYSTAQTMYRAGCCFFLLVAASSAFRGQMLMADNHVGQNGQEITKHGLGMKPV